MKYLTLLLLPLLILTLKINPPTIEPEREDYQVYSYPAKWPTREKVLISAFREQTPQAKKLLTMESGISPVAVNKSSGACGVGQALPCSKMNCKLTHDIRDFMCQVFWVKNYLSERYGDAETALAHELAEGWY